MDPEDEMTPETQIDDMRSKIGPLGETARAALDAMPPKVTSYTKRQAAEEARQPSSTPRPSAGCW